MRIPAVRYAVGESLFAAHATEEGFLEVDLLAVPIVWGHGPDEVQHLRVVIRRVWLGRLADHLRVGRRERAAIHAGVRQDAFVQDVHRLNAAVWTQLEDLPLEDLDLHPEQQEDVGNGVAEATDAAADAEVVPECVLADAIARLLEEASVVGDGRGRW